MKPANFLRLQPTLQMIAEQFDLLKWDYKIKTANEHQSYQGARIYSGQTKLNPDLIYILTEERKDQFPADRYSYLCSSPRKGKANHICCPQNSPEQLLEPLLELFQRYQEQENQLNQLVLSNASLNDLCNFGETLLGNPICIHDDWFIITAMSDDLPQVMPPENISTSSKRFIPRKFIDSFQYDADYLKSYTHQRAELWISCHQPESERCMYVNLWNGSLYRGRLLIIEASQPFRPSHFLIAECLAQRAMLILNNQNRSKHREYHSIDDIVYSLLTGQTPDAADLTLLLETLKWKKSVQYLCVRFQSQSPDSTEILGHVLHSDLFQRFPNSYIMYIKHQQCMILNLSREGLPASQVRHLLAPLCRDYFLYAGISSPIRRMEELKFAFRQADLALEKAFYLHNEQWAVSFSACVLDYLVKNIPPELPGEYLVSPELLTLIEYDKEKNTQYYPTLRAFLLNERDISKTSKIMIIHRTTLIYRLKKIQSMTNINLDDPDERLYLLFSFRLLNPSS